jgi:hypothetical protein
MHGRNDSAASSSSRVNALAFEAEYRSGLERERVDSTRGRSGGIVPAVHPLPRGLRAGLLLPWTGTAKSSIRWRCDEPARAATSPTTILPTRVVRTSDFHRRRAGRPEASTPSRTTTTTTMLRQSNPRRRFSQPRMQQPQPGYGGGGGAGGDYFVGASSSSSSSPRWLVAAPSDRRLRCTRPR